MDGGHVEDRIGNGGRRGLRRRSHWSWLGACRGRLLLRGCARFAARPEADGNQQSTEQEPRQQSPFTTIEVATGLFLHFDQPAFASTCLDGNRPRHSLWRGSGSATSYLYNGSEMD